VAIDVNDCRLDGRFINVDPAGVPVAEFEVVEARFVGLEGDVDRPEVVEAG